MEQEFIQMKCVRNRNSHTSPMISDSENVLSNTTKQQQKDDILDVVGDRGPWQRRIFVTMVFLIIPTAFHNMSMSFLAPNIDHWCARPPGAANLSVEQWRSVAMPSYDQRCSRYEHINFSYYSQRDDINDTSSPKVIPCDSWEYEKTIYTSTVVSEWHLVCDREWFVSMSKSVYMVGILVTVIVFGYFADRMGRRPALAVTSFIGIFSAIVCTFSTSFMMFIIARFLTAVGMAGFYNTLFVLLMEIVGPELRSTYGLAVQFGWCIGFVSLPAIAWLLLDWFWIQFAITAPCAPMLAVWWMLPESPRWLLSKGKMEDASKILRQAAEINGMNSSDMYTKLKKVMSKHSEANKSDDNDGNVFDLLRTAGLRQMTLIIYFIWFVISFVYYGLSYNTNELAGNPFINFAISGIVEIPAYFLSIFAIRSLGRRNPLAATMVIGGLACLLSYVLPQNPWWMTVAVSMIGKFFITSAFGIVYIFTSELFPTIVRNIGLGSASLCARLGSILAPFIRELGYATHPIVPQIVFGSLAAVSGVLVLLLPETNNCSVPDTFKEAADASRKNGKKSNPSNENRFIVTLSNGITAAPQEGVTSQVFRVITNQETARKELADARDEESHSDKVETVKVATTINTTKFKEEMLKPADGNAEDSGEIPTPITTAVETCIETGKQSEVTAHCENL